MQILIRDLNNNTHNRDLINKHKDLNNTYYLSRPYNLIDKIMTATRSVMII